MTPDSGSANLEVCCAFVDELAASGLHHAVICPGSRSTPLALALTAHPHLETWVQVDERSAAFFAMGMARHLNEPVALLCTSGTAAANFAPAVAEASLSRIPLLVLTADRPPELRDWGAAQTIDQIGLYGSHTRWFVEMPVPDGANGLTPHARAVARRAFSTAAQPPAGPVHLNFPFREPLLPLDLRPPLDLQPLFAAGRRLQPVQPAPPITQTLAEDAIGELADILAGSPRGLIVAGPGEQPGLPSALSALSATTGYPILADPLSGARFGSPDRIGLIDSYDSFLRHAETAANLAPEVVIRVGAIPTSKPLLQFLTSFPGDHHLLIDSGPPRDPLHLATRYLTADPAETICRLSTATSRINRNTHPDWLSRWRGLDTLTSQVITSELSNITELFEGRACAEVASLLPEGASLVVGNSMPIRDVDTFVRGDARSLRVLGNRGANGIDGLISTALGAAAVSTTPVVLLLGDLSFYHDMNGLLAAARHGLSATIVVLNNNGGGIFSFLPQAQQLAEPLFESLFGTPIDLEISAAAALYGSSYARPATWPVFRRSLSSALSELGLSIIEVVTERKRNLELHRTISSAVTEALHSARAVEFSHA